MMVRVNLAQESPVGISVKNPGGARFPGITWAWLTTQNPGSPGEAGDGARGPSIQVLCALLTAATHLGSWHLSAFPTCLTPCRPHFISCQPFSKTHSGRSRTRVFFGTFQGPPRRAASCCRCCPLPCRELEVWRSRGAAPAHR